MVRAASRIAALLCGLALAAGCGGDASEGPESAPESAPVVPEIELEAPWRVERQTETAVVLRLGDSGDGVRVQLAPDAHGRLPGLSPIVGGRTVEVETGSAIHPLIGAPHPIGAATVAVEGPDLVVDLPGPPIETLTDHPLAPADPVPLRIRVRPRAVGWRVVVDGLTIVSLPEPDAVWPADPRGWALHRGVRVTEVQVWAPRRASGMRSGRWWLSTVPSLEVQQTMPRVALTLSP